ncbi:hypothetical protein ASPZODRAFT_103554 [Penicilliopsis zonata CBS 506.65]|uniref:histidine kinase n=1 Tax=Penicilliopsis zonata CBS 506.65 TaxID=1073090 RepID=A0A1L9S7R9_9EURO|nr:hypothetical protein ASPZODRAFT_103554 [Penicilliopsis zonata CBS 506.65]OJJ43184.1 hypothetical protein ASPZODRAFT_103554 [Penicilliopsis zonata CBS 506.65]
MESYASPALNQPPPSESERERIRELSQYYCTIRAAESEATTESETTTAPSLSRDIALTALTQLAVHRFGCDRAFVSLIDGQNQHILAEATASISLRDSRVHRAGEGIYLGVTTLDLAFGVCPHAVKLFTGQPVPVLQNTANMTATKTRFVVKDFTAEAHFKDRPYVLDWPYFRFYAEVPIYSVSSGYVLGSFCVVDNKPRVEFGDADVAALQEISDAIASHLENVRIRNSHRRADRLVQGLTTFVQQGQTQLCSASSSTHALRGASLSGLRDSVDESLSPMQDLSISAKTTRSPSLLRSRQLSDTEGTSIQDSDNQQNHHHVDDETTAAGAVETMAVSSRLTAIFAHAASLLRGSMDLAGVLFLDASRCNGGIVESESEWPFPHTNDHSPSGGTEILSFEGDGDAVQFTRMDSLLQYLVATYPQGGIFDLTEGDEGDQQQQQSSPVGELRRYFSHSAIFLPLWDWEKSQWLAGTFLWTAGHSRALGPDELHYFKVFGDSIVSEVARVNWDVQQQAKSTFVSSISHELRSPLHGMLAGTELLAATELADEQRDLLTTVETCGVTLLDTMNHLLDFTKINSLTDGSTITTFDLARLVEDVVTTMYMGRRSSRPHKESAKLSVVLRIEDDWTVQSITGAWRRIVMNILGNALKYTPAGFIEISLSRAAASTAATSLAHLRVTDSGQGMSASFLRNKLFTPFAQEDALADGVGLGLSIVQQLVGQLDGSIDIQSERGVGTQVDIYIPIDMNAVSVQENPPKEAVPTTHFCLIGLNALPDLKEAPTGTLDAEAKRRLCIRRFLTHLIPSQPGWSLSFAETLDQARGDVLIVDPELSKSALDETAVLSVLVGEKTEHLSQPLSPRKVLKALQSICGQFHSAPCIQDQPVHPCRHALLVDDNEINLKILAKYMAKLGYTYETALNGAIAVEKYKSNTFDIILMVQDISMPVMNGLVATRHIRTLEQVDKDEKVKIYAVTGVASADMQTQARAAGVDGYLVKPLSLTALASELNSCI